MRIVITMHSVKGIDRLLNDIYEKYARIITLRSQPERKLALITGDVIAGYPIAMSDGVSADVAIGIEAEYISCASNQEKPVWEYEDLYKYLDGIMELRQVKEITMKQYINFEELENYMLKPVYDNEQKRWKILKGYAKVEDKKMVMFTETDFTRCSSEWIIYTDTLLSDHDKN